MESRKKRWNTFSTTLTNKDIGMVWLASNAKVDRLGQQQMMVKMNDPIAAESRRSIRSVFCHVNDRFCVECGHLRAPPSAGFFVPGPYCSSERPDHVAMHGLLAK